MAQLGGPSAIGVLALQGGYHAHAKVLNALGHDVCLVRYAHQLPDLAGLVLPGGESTTMLKVIDRENLGDGLDAFVRSGRPVLATCAGMILAARSVSDPEQKSFGWIDIDVTRMGFGRQLDSFEATSDDGTLPLLFIRAPRIVAVGAGVDVLARYQSEPIMVKQGAVVAASFHPELTADSTVHHMVFGTPS
ncbi:MAG: 5'-phosphate synthase pdxT subunit [Myxococcota bacterium]